jgi:pyruvate,water dikinase
MRWLLRYAHESVRRREQTKSLFTKIGHEFKRAYRHLSTLLVEEGHLPEADLMYFYTRSELADFIKRPTQATVERARSRRRALAYQERLRFPEICVGRPEPLMRQASQGAGRLVGRPVSAGVVEGPARVAHSPAEASAIEPGDILVTPITDVGWTPYFRSIAGLATDLGSVVSHGAVIAREYGLPCVVNLGTASQEFRTGQVVRLDADRGVLERIG